MRGGRVAFTARYRVMPEAMPTVLRSLRTMAELVRRHEPDCLTYHVNRDPDDDDVLFLYEVYVDDDAYRRHCETDHFVEQVVTLVRPLLTERTVARYQLEVW